MPTLVDAMLEYLCIVCMRAICMILALLIPAVVIVITVAIVAPFAASASVSASAFVSAASPSSSLVCTRPSQACRLLS